MGGSLYNRPVNPGRVLQSEQYLFYTTMGWSTRVKPHSFVHKLLAVRMLHVHRP